MPAPAGYRTALRLMRLAERFNLPVVTLVSPTSNASTPLPLNSIGKRLVLLLYVSNLAPTDCHDHNYRSTRWVPGRPSKPSATDRARSVVCDPLLDVTDVLSSHTSTLTQSLRPLRLSPRPLYAITRS